MTLAYLKGKDAESQEAQEHANSSKAGAAHGELNSPETNFFVGIRELSFDAASKARIELFAKWMADGYPR